MKKILFIFCFGLTFLSCSNDDDNNTPFEPTSIEFNEIGQGTLPGVGAEGIVESNMIITNDNDWQNLINQMNSYYNETTNTFLTETDINFNNQIVLAIFLEVKNSQWTVEITEMIEYENAVIVTSEQEFYSLPVVTQPFHIVKISKTNKPFEFESTSPLDD